MIVPAGWAAWSPPFAPHVHGAHEPHPVEQQGGEVGQRWIAECTRCGAEHRGLCVRRAVRRNVAQFAALHADCPGKRG